MSTTVVTKQKKPTLDPTAYAISRENRERKKKLQAEFTAVAKKISDENRKASAEEQEKMDKIYADVQICDENIDRAEKVTIDLGNDDVIEEQTRRIEHLEKELEQRGKKPPSQPDTRVCKLQRYGETDEEYAVRERRTKPEYIAACKDFLRYGKAGLNKHIENRNLQADFDYKGGYLVMPEQMSNKVLKAVDDIIWLMKKANVTKLANAQSLGIPSLDTNPEDSDWTTEIATVDEDTAMAFGKRVLMPQPARKLLKVSERWLRMAMQAYFDTTDDANGQGGSPANMVTNRLAYKAAYTKEAAFHTGTGVGRPLGMYIASTRGISTGRDATISTTNALTYSQLIAAKWTLKVQYHRTAEWEFSRALMQRLMQLVDSYGRPILNWQTIPNTPTMLLEHPVNLSEFTPNTFSNGAYVGMLGDYSFYHVADSLEFMIKRLDELYAETSQIGFITAFETDGMPVLEEAFVRLKWAT